MRAVVIYRYRDMNLEGILILYAFSKTIAIGSFSMESKIPLHAYAMVYF